MFLEQIEFTELSDDRLCTFVDFFDSSEMSSQLWNKLSKCILSQTERKQKTKATIVVGGANKIKLLVEEPNNRNEDGYPVISPPLNSSLDSSSLLSYSVYGSYSVMVKKGGSMLGDWYSLFETREDKVISCGYNSCGELLFKSGPSKEYVYSPIETTITGGAKFCITGACFSAVFVGGDPPPNTPNMPIQHHQ